jgi:signal transduction histidine kinase
VFHFRSRVVGLSVHGTNPIGRSESVRTRDVREVGDSAQSRAVIGPAARHLTLACGRALVLIVLVGAAYFLTAQFSLALILQPDGVAAFWPAAGISSGILVALGPRARWPVAAGVIAATIGANLTSDRNIWAAVVFALANAAEALITAGLVQHYFRSKFDFDRLPEVLGLFAASVIATTFSGFIGTIGYKLFHSSTVPMLLIWWHWFASDVLGIIAVAPLVIRIGVATRNPPSRREALEGTVALILLGVMMAIVLSLPDEPWKTTLPVALLFPTLLWLAARCPPGYSAAGAFIVSITVVWTTILGIGHFGERSLAVSDRLLQGQTTILVVTIGTYVLSALFAERRASAARLANSYMLLEHERDSKLLSIEAAVGWIAHEIKQPMTGIAMTNLAALQYLGKTPPDEEKANAALNLIRDQLARLDEVLDGIRAVFRPGEKVLAAVDVNELIRRVLDAFREDFARDKIVVRLDLGASLPPVDGNASQLQQVISNLIRNAQEAMKTTEDRRRELRLRTELNGEDGIEIAVEDTGPGIDPTKLDQAFNAFFTTKTQGMGMGLAMCRLIAERHGGTISAFSDGKNGAQFNITIPVKPSDSAIASE